MTIDEAYEIVKQDFSDGRVEEFAKFFASLKAKNLTRSDKWGDVIRAEDGACPICSALDAPRSNHRAYDIGTKNGYDRLVVTAIVKTADDDDTFVYAYPKLYAALRFLLLDCYQNPA